MFNRWYEGRAGRMSGADERGEGLEIGGEVGGGCVVCLFLLKKVKYGRD